MSNLEARQSGLESDFDGVQAPVTERAVVLDSDWANALARQRPEFSAAKLAWGWQRLALAVWLCAIAAGCLAAPGIALTLMFAALAPLFFLVVLVRLVALVRFVAAKTGPASGSAPGVVDQSRPVYTLLIPLLRERDVLPALIAAVERIDYPRSRLDVIFAVEDNDSETRTALAAMPLPVHMRVVVVPPGHPRTKPRALMYALQFARGTYVVVYDAEDQPDPAQLHRALAVFNAGDGKIGCVQAQLNTDNPDENWLTRQFTLEYSALFDAILPALRWLTLPVPLGGTSNHFPRAVLDEVGGWDPYNVTEDADLGVRLARAGWQVEILPSTTFEEAPAVWSVWFGQRVRWLKGWMQTLIVHTRQPVRLVRDLGLVRAIGFSLSLGGLLLSALVHPVFYCLVAYRSWQGESIWVPLDGSVPSALWMLGIANLLLAYGVSALLAMIAVRRRGRPHLAIQALWLPVYWLAISAAAYRALFQLVTAPHWWEKTAHRARRVAPDGG